MIAAFAHIGPARRLAHNLKYKGLTGYADLVAAVLAPRLAHAPLVPVPRVPTRRLKYGVDPALELAMSLSRLTGAPVVRALSPPLHAPRRAGGDHRRRVARPRLRDTTLEKLVLVDDVVTTGATLEAVVSVLGHERVLVAAAANAVPAVSARHRDDSVGP